MHVMTSNKNNSNTWHAVPETLDSGEVVRWQLMAQSAPLSFRRFISLLIDDAGFRRHFNKLFANNRFESFRFETPALDSYSLDKPFEFVLINAPGLARQSVDPLTFAEHFPVDSVTGNVAETPSVVEFNSLRGDATLISPSPIASHEIYKHLASFTRAAPASQIDRLWQTVGLVLQRDLGDAPLWLNTEGSGVAWLHIRIDTRPKYYGYTNYKLHG